MNNASKGGPKTKAGKKTSSKNAFKHGMTSTHLFEGDERILNDTLQEELIREYQPATVTEEMYISRIASTYIRLQRILSVEEAYYGLAELNAVTKMKRETQLTWDEDTKAQYKKSFLAGDFNTFNDKKESKRRLQFKLVSEVGELLRSLPINNFEVIMLKAPLLNEILSVMSVRKEVGSSTLLKTPFINDEKLIEEVSAIPIPTKKEMKEVEKKQKDNKADQENLHAELIEPFLHKLNYRLYVIEQAYTASDEIIETGRLYRKSAMPEAATMDKVMRYSTTLSNQLSKAIGELRQIIKERKAAEKTIVDE